MKILITGATGNVGKEIIRSLDSLQHSNSIIAGVSNIERAQKSLIDFKIDEFRKIDFEDSSTFNTVLKNIDIVFLLRPPHLANIKTFFTPFFNTMKQKGINKVVFLSVQGVETQTKIPHYKMEQTILKFDFEYVFLRPSYFMQNLTSTLLNDIKNKNQIFIPAGKLKMNWVDAIDIGFVGAKVINQFDIYKNREFEITGAEFVGFHDVAFLLSNVLERQISYVSPNLFRFFITMRRNGLKPAMIFVMIMLHYLPRFSTNKERLVNTVKEITEKKPGKLRDFIIREKGEF